MLYQNATICKNGHIISRSDANAEKFCSKCGELTYSDCQNCGAPIRGLPEIPGVTIIGHRDYDLPHYCYECGTPYPWTQLILDNAVELLSLDIDLSDDSKNLIKNAIPSLIVDSPSTPVAITKYKKGVSSASEMLKNAFRQLLIDVVCEAARKALFS